MEYIINGDMMLYIMEIPICGIKSVAQKNIVALNTYMNPKSENKLIRHLMQDIWKITK